MVNYINNKKAQQLNPDTLYNLNTNPSACNNYNCINNQIPNTIQQYGYEIPSVLDLATLVSPTSPSYYSFSPTQQAQNMRNSAQNQPSQTGPAQSQYNEAAQDLAVREIQNIDATQPYNPETLPTPAMINEFVEKILVHQAQGKGASRIQEIEIFFNFVGKVDIPHKEVELTEEESQDLANYKDFSEYRALCANCAHAIIDNLFT